MINIVTPSKSVKLLGITIDNDLKFDLHINDICRKANNKIWCLYRIRKYLDEKHARRLCNAFVLSNFNYCPLIWMYCNKTLDAKINRVHKRALRAVTGIYDKSLDELLSSEGGLMIHSRSLQTLLAVIYKSLLGLNADIMRDLFCLKISPYSLRISCLLSLPPTKSIRFGSNSILFRGSQLWNSLPDSIKMSKNVEIFKQNVSSWVGLKCLCPLCSD